MVGGLHFGFLLLFSRAADAEWLIRFVCARVKASTPTSFSSARRLLRYFSLQSFRVAQLLI